MPIIYFETSLWVKNDPTVESNKWHLHEKLGLTGPNYDFGYMKKNDKMYQKK